MADVFDARSEALKLDNLAKQAFHELQPAPHYDQLSTELFDLWTNPEHVKQVATELENLNHKGGGLPKVTVSYDAQNAVHMIKFEHSIWDGSAQHEFIEVEQHASAIGAHLVDN